MHINFHFEKNGNETIAEDWLLNLLSAHNIQSVGLLTLTERGELLPLSPNGFPYLEVDGAVTSLLQTLCTSILNGAKLLTDMKFPEDPDLLTSWKLAKTVDVSTMIMEDNTCHISISFSLER